jgi:hypothetical protein
MPGTALARPRDQDPHKFPTTSNGPRHGDCQRPPGISPGQRPASGSRDRTRTYNLPGTWLAPQPGGRCRSIVATTCANAQRSWSLSGVARCREASFPVIIEWPYPLESPGSDHGALQLSIGTRGKIRTWREANGQDTARCLFRDHDGGTRPIERRPTPIGGGPDGRR